MASFYYSVNLSFILADLFAEYGVVSATIVRDTDKQSKGFAFIELANRQDADLAIDEMDGFYLDNSRKLVVKLSVSVHSSTYIQHALLTVISLFTTDTKWSGRGASPTPFKRLGVSSCWWSRVPAGRCRNGRASTGA